MIWRWYSRGIAIFSIERKILVQTGDSPYVSGLMHRPRLAQLAALLALAAGLGACVQTTGSYRAPEFSPSLLAVRGVNVGSLESEAPGPNLGSRDEEELIAALTSQISKNKKLFLTRSPNGFVLNATVTRNDVDRWIANDCRVVEEPVYDEDGKKIGCVSRTIYVTTANTRRSVEAKFELIDPTFQKVAWAWSGANSSELSRCNESGHCHPPAPLFPEPPETREVASALMRTAARKLIAKP